jgi:hypothetical protein
MHNRFRGTVRSQQLRSHLYLYTYKRNITSVLFKICSGYNRFRIEKILSIRCTQITSELIADENFSMLSKNLFDLAQAFETFLLISY